MVDRHWWVCVCTYGRPPLICSFCIAKLCRWENDIFTLHRLFIGRILCQMIRFGLALDNHSCLTLSVDVACLSSDISVVPIPVKTISELFSRAFWVLKETGVAVGRPRQSWLRTVEDLSISAWRQQGGAHWIDRHGCYSWRRLRLLDMLMGELGKHI